MNVFVKSILAVAIVLAGCDSQPESVHVAIGPSELPDQSYVRPPTVPFNKSDYVIKLEHMTSFYMVPGEAGYSVDGNDYGFESLSFILTETHPRGGPPLHTHEVEEAHVVLSGTMRYVLGDRQFTVAAPFIARVPAGAAHTFVNGGETPLNLIAVFPSGRLDYTELGPNPLVED